MVQSWTFNDTDRAITQELRAFFPQKLFDSHAHLYRMADLCLPDPGLLGEGPREVNVAVWRNTLEQQMGAGRLAGGLFLPYPVTASDQAHLDAANDFLADQLATTPEGRGLILVGPDYSPERAAHYLANPRIVGFKPYHTYSVVRPTGNSAMNDFVPEWAWEMAQSRGLILLIHLMRDGALADPDNQRQLCEHCRRYPNARVVLAHAGRGFHTPNTVEHIQALRGLNNVWFDTAAICDAGAFLAVLREFGPRRLLWGSDFPISETRGKPISLGDGFFWMQPDTALWNHFLGGRGPTLVGIESLRALREAAQLFPLSPADLEDVCFHNARRLVGLEEEPVNQTQELYRYAKTRIPGGTQLLSKRPEMFAPDVWPAYFREARGCEVWDLDGRHYYDFTSNGIGACLLGFRDPDVSAAVLRRVQLGSMSTLNPPDEVALADTLCEMHPWAEQVRLTRAGGETATVAVRIARATTDRSAVAFCGYHGWHDWYLAANLGESDALRGHLLPGLEPLGVPRELRGTAYPFSYQNRQELIDIVDQHGSRLAAIIMEPCRYLDPEPGYLEFVRDQAHRCGALLVFDEITIGFRLHQGGSHLRFGVNPDIAIFAKALGNGHPIGAIIGTRGAMEGAHDSFISSTYWTESVGPAAGLATLRKLQHVDAPAHVAHIGQAVKQVWLKIGACHGLPVESDAGYACLAHFHFTGEKAKQLSVLFTQRMLHRGFLAGGSIYPTMAHTDEIVALYAEAVDAVFAELADLLRRDAIEAALEGPIAHSGFRRLL